MNGDPHALALRMAPWVQGLLNRSSGPVVSVDRGVNLQVGGVEVRLVDRDQRGGVTRDPRLLVRAAQSGFFDLREWIDVLDCWSSSEPVGADQLEALDLLTGRSELGDPSMIRLLRQARDRWVHSMGEGAVEPSTPAWPDGLFAPDWLEELDEGLLSLDFDTGWVVSCGLSPIGVVRQRGAIRIQLAVLEGVASVQVASWPNAGWCPLDVIGAAYDMPTESADQVVAAANHYCDMAYARFAPPKWGSKELRERHRNQADDRQIGPDPYEAHFVVEQRHPSDYLEPSDWARVGRLMMSADTWDDRPTVARIGRGPCPPIMSAGDRSYLTAEATEVFRQLCPEAAWFEFDVEGSGFASPGFPAICLDDPTDYGRSVVGQFGAVPGGLVIHPLQARRPGELLFRGSQWIVDGAGADLIRNTLPGVRLMAAWDPT